ncbi:MAG TPA: hypothetical protein P5317_11950 [Myxococcota bacterium]|nr:hypothetical protein [Myxococcota bacterium]HRV18708.1 hypothetical protein [Myxococcota bacterium]
MTTCIDKNISGRACRNEAIYPDDRCFIHSEYSPYRCRAKGKNGQRCKRQAIDDTGYCAQCAPQNLSRTPIKPTVQELRRYAHLPPALLERYERSLDDPNLLAMNQELALVDARLGQLIAQLTASVDFENLADAISDLELSLQRQDTDGFQIALRSIKTMISRGKQEEKVWEDISKTVLLRKSIVDAERSYMVRAGQMITMEHAIVMASRLLGLMALHVQDVTALAQIRNDFAKIIEGEVKRLPEGG